MGLSSHVCLQKKIAGFTCDWIPLITSPSTAVRCSFWANELRVPPNRVEAVIGANRDFVAKVAFLKLQRSGTNDG